MVDYPINVEAAPNSFMYFGPGNPYTEPGPGLWYNTAGDRILFGVAGTIPADTIIRAYRSTSASQGEAWAEVDAANHPTDCQNFEEVFVVRHPTDSTIVCVVYNRAASGQPDIVVHEFNLESLGWGISYGGTSFPNRQSSRYLLQVIGRPLNGDLVMAFAYSIAPNSHIAFVTITPGAGATWNAEVEAFPGQPASTFPASLAVTFYKNLTGGYCNNFPHMAVTASGKVYLLFGLYYSATKLTDVYHSIMDTDDSVTSAKICDGVVGDFAGWTGMLTELTMGSSIVSSGDKVFIFLGAVHYDCDTSTYSWSTYAGYCADGDALTLNLAEITEKPHAAGKGIIYPQAYYLDGKVWLFLWDDCNNPLDHNFYCTYSTASPPVRSGFSSTNDLFPSTAAGGWIDLSPEQFVLLPEGRLACTVVHKYWEVTYAVPAVARGWAVIGRGPAAVKLNASGGYARCG